MKLFIVIFATAAVAAASVINRKHVDLMDDNTIIIRGDNGKLIKISRENGQKNIEIQVTGPNTVTKKIQIDENNHVIVKNGNDYQLSTSREDMKNLQDERSKRSFMFDRQNDLHDTMFNKDQEAFNDATLWNTMAFQQDIHDRRFDDLNNPTLMDKVGLDETLAKSYQMDSMMYPRWNVMKRMTRQNMEQQFDTRTLKMMMTKILMRMLDEQVMMRMLNEFGQNQRWNEKVLDNMLNMRDIFDRKVLVELIENSFLRDMMINQRIFDRSTMEMVINKRITRGSLDQLVNREILKNWMVRLGCCDRDILREMVQRTIVENMMTTEMNDRQWLMEVLNDSMLRKFLVHQGIFNEDIIEKCLYNMKTDMRYREDLLKQVINKRNLRNNLIQRGFIDMSMLNEMMRNEVLGLKVLLKVITLDQTPRMSYRQMMSMVGNKPELMITQMRTVPLGDDLVGVTMRKSITLPVMNIDDQLDSDRYRSTTNYRLWDMFSKHRQGLSRQGMLGDTYDFERMQRDFNQMPMREDLM